MQWSAVEWGGFGFFGGLGWVFLGAKERLNQEKELEKGEEGLDWWKEGDL